MRKIFVSAAAAAALAIPALSLSLTTTPASADSDTGQSCTQAGNLGLSHGACINLLGQNSNSSAFWASVCKLIQRQDQIPAPFNGFKNLGECVSFFDHLPTPTLTVTPTPTPTPTPKV